MVATHPEPVAVVERGPPRLKRSGTLRALKQVVRVVCALLEVWESYQVELQGSYSVVRLQELVAFSEVTSWCSALATVTLTPLSSIASIVLADILPLQPA